MKTKKAQLQFIGALFSNPVLIFIIIAVVIYLGFFHVGAMSVPEKLTNMGCANAVIKYSGVSSVGCSCENYGGKLYQPTACSLDQCNVPPNQKDWITLRQSEGYSECQSAILNNENGVQYVACCMMKDGQYAQTPAPTNQFPGINPTDPSSPLPITNPVTTIAPVLTNVQPAVQQSDGSSVAPGNAAPATPGSATFLDKISDFIQNIFTKIFSIFK